MKADTYTILINGKEVYTSLSQMEYFERMEDLSLDFYQTAVPNPDDIQTKIIKGETF